MHPMLVTVFVSVTSLAFSDILYGHGTIYIAQLKGTNESLGLIHRIVYKPQQPEVYTGSIYEAHMSTEMSNNEKRVSSTHTMKWDEYGMYYYAQTHPSNLTEEDYPLTFSYEFVIYEDGYFIYIDDFHAHSTLTSYARYCVLDTEQHYYYDYTCSQALEDRSLVATTETLSDHAGRNIGAIISSIFALLLVILVVRVWCWKQWHQKTPRYNNVLPQADDVEGTSQTNIATEDPANVPPSYDIAMQGFLPENSTNSDQHLSEIENSGEHPPPYAVAV